MKPLYGKRTWVKLWVSEWLDGTTRFQMSGAERAFWIDLLAMAGRSRHPEVVCAGKDGDVNTKGLVTVIRNAGPR